jgi:hypothetical protein
MRKGDGQGEEEDEEEETVVAAKSVTRKCGQLE